MFVTRDERGSAPGGFAPHFAPAPLGTIERLPKWLLCVPLVAQWFWLGLRYGSLTLPSTVNPAIATGGLAGESKLDCLALIAANYAPWVAPTQPVRPGECPNARRAASGLAFPLIAKPDVGWCGYGVRRIGGAAELSAYAAAFPADATYLLQAFVPGPMEAGLFYIREANAAHGALCGIAVRHQPHVRGDGTRSVAELSAADPRLRKRSLDAGLAAHVPEAGETVVLSTVASLRVGGRYEDAMRLRSPALEHRIDAIANSMGGFQFGRFDVRFTSEAALRAGEFQIIEVNGAGSEAIQFWDPAIGLWAAYRGVFEKQAALFALAAECRKLGRRPVGVVGLSRAWLAQQRLIRRYPVSN